MLHDFMYMGVSWMFQACFEEIARIFQECFKGIEKEVLKSAPRKFQDCFREVSTMCQ